MNSIITTFSFNCDKAHKVFLWWKCLENNYVNVKAVTFHSESPFSECVKYLWALAGVAQWIEHWPANQRVISLIPSQGSSCAVGHVPSRGAWETTTHWYFSPSPSPSLLLFLKMNKIKQNKIFETFIASWKYDRQNLIVLNTPMEVVNVNRQRLKKYFEIRNIRCILFKTCFEH